MSSLLDFTVSGTGNKTIVFIHGFLESKKMWKEIASAFADFTVYCIDLKGHGSSPEIKRDNWSIDDFALEILRLMQQEKKPSFSIVGHSLGGYVALSMAREQFKNIEKLVLLNSHPWADSEQKKKERTLVAQFVYERKNLFIQQVIPNLFLSPENHSEEAQRLINDAKEMSVSSIVQTTYAMRDRVDQSECLIHLGQNALVIQGEFDPLINATKMEAFCLANKINFKLINGTGHMGHIEAKKEVKQVLKEFIKF